jgi:hypothetical protein
LVRLFSKTFFAKKSSHPADGSWHQDSELGQHLDFFAPPLFTSAAPPHLPLPLLPEQPAEQEELDPHVEDAAEANPKLEEAQPMERCDVRIWVLTCVHFIFCYVIFG